MGSPKKKPGDTLPAVTFEQRLLFGNLTVDETCALAGCSRTRFYEDLKLGLVTVTKFGRSTRIPGPVAQRYARGEQTA